MNKRLCLLFVILCFAGSLSLPTTPAAAQGSSFQEGAYLLINRGFTIANQQVTIKAVKTTTFSSGRSTRVSTFEFAVICPYSQGSPSLLVQPVTVQVPGDPDNVAISRDLGWAGLDAVVSVFDQTSQSNVNVEIHAYWWANTSVSESNGLFTRGARLEGRITTPKCSFDLSWPPGPANLTIANIFSTREPRPRY